MCVGVTHRILHSELSLQRSEGSNAVRQWCTGEELIMIVDRSILLSLIPVTFLSFSSSPFLVCLCVSAVAALLVVAHPVCATIALYTLRLYRRFPGCLGTPPSVGSRSKRTGANDVLFWKSVHISWLTSSVNC
jgi:hypothetical protein